MSLEVPEIRDLDALLRPHLPDGVGVVSYTAKRLTVPGENYGSTMLAVQVNTDDDNVIECVAKLCPNNEWLKKMFCVQHSFKKEIALYREVMPELEAFQLERGVPVTDILPKCLGSRINLEPGSDLVTDDAVILLENLKVSGFRTGDRMKGFGLEAARLVLRDLAKFHAVPVAMKVLEKERYEKKIQPHLYKLNPGEQLSEETQEKAIKEILANAKTQENCVQYLRRCGEGMKKGADFFRNPLPVTDAFGTIVHNDFSVNNTMIRFEDDKPVQNKIVDFQFFSYGSAVRDLIFFLYSSIDKSILLEKFDELAEFYFGCFVECLKDLKFDTKEYTLELFQNEMDAIAPTEFFHIIILLRPILAVEGNIKSIEDMDEDGLWKGDIDSDLYQKCLATIIVAFAEKNWI